MRTRYRLTSAGLALAAAMPVHAAETTAPVVVTATRTPITADDALASVSVITREAIERRQPLDVPDLLSGLPGVDFARNGGRGNTASLFLRGTNSDHILVLVDGVRVSSATDGAPALENLAVSEIERVEVVRGPRAALYGADAIGGVIQIFTRRNDGAHASVGIGNRDTQTVQAGIGRSGEDGFWSLDASRFVTDGFDATDEDNFSHDPDDDGYRQTAVSARGERDLTDDLTVDAALQHREGDPRFDGSPGGADTTQRHLTAGADWQASDAWTVRLSAAGALDDYDGRAFDGDRFVTKRRSFTLQNDLYPTPNQIVTLGVDYYRDEVGGTIDYAEDSRDNVGAFLQQQWRLDAWSLQLGARHDDNEAYGETTTGSAAAGYRFDNGVRAFASFGTAFKAPSFNDLYYPDVGFFRGNPDLEPERSRSWEAGLSGGRDWRWEVAAFRTKVDDLIVFDATTAQSQNVDEARIKGVEASLSTTISGIDTRLNASWVDPRDVETDNRLPRRSRVSAGIDLSRRVGPAELGGSVRYRGDRYDAIANETELGGYTLVDLNAAWYFSPAWVLRATVHNATDRDYQTADTYNTPGRTAMLTLSWNQNGH